MVQETRGCKVLSKELEVYLALGSLLLHVRDRTHVFTCLQGWRLFAEAHKMQAGDQVAFELVGERRLVAQIIKSADPGQYPPMSSSQRQKSAQDRKRKAQIACFARPSYRPCMEMQEAQVCPPISM